MNRGAQKISAYAWAVVALLWPVAMLNYLDRQMVSTIRASIRADIPSIANDQDFGTLMAVFMWVYAFLSPVGGYIADRFNRRWTIIASLFVWSAVTWLTGQAQTYSQMLTCRGLMGVSEAFYIPAALALIADFHTGGTRAKAIGIHQTGIYAGLALGGIGGYIAQTSSWRNCFTWFGAAGVIYAVVLMLTLKDAPAEDQSAAEKKKSVAIWETIRALWSQPAFWILVVYFTLPAIAGWANKNWLPTFLADTFKLTQGPAGLAATGYIQLASLGGVFLGGVVADGWMRRTNRGRIYTSALGVLLLVPALLGIGYAWNLGVVIAAMIAFGIGWGFYDCNNMPILCQIARPEHRATGYGFMNLVSISVGAGATVALGWMRDHGVKFSVAFAVSAAVALLSAGLILLIKPNTGNLERS
ncbi:MAG: MFS transporter [Verrucomicrobiae bacterium]|nr:MFS transporter [Verrucomicrobiae bacterium]